MSSIQKRENGTYTVRIRRKGRNISKTFRSKKDALQWAREQETKLDKEALDHVTRPTGGISVAEMMRMYIDARHEDLSPSTLGYYESELARLETTKLGKMPIQAATESDIRAHMKAWRNAGNRDGTVRRKLSLIKGMYAWALDHGYEIPNAVRRIKLPSDTRRVMRWDDSSVQKLREADAHMQRKNKNPWIGPAFELALTTPLRRGDITNILLEDVHLEERRIHLRNTKPGKPRDVWLTEEAATIVQKVMKLDREPGEKRLFACNKDAFKSAWRRRKELAGVRQTFHDTKAEAISKACEKGLPLAELKEYSGNSDHRSLEHYMRARDAKQMLNKLNQQTRPSLG
nr:tyrosine-type recombinase/integrase [Oceanococcus sp. HetDA_MAG_MS8]